MTLEEIRELNNKASIEKERIQLHLKNRICPNCDSTLNTLGGKKYYITLHCSKCNSIYYKC